MLSLPLSRRAVAVPLALVFILIVGMLVGAGAPASAAPAVYARDAMSRSVTSGWGKAERGGGWSNLSGTKASVSGGKAWVASPRPGRTSRLTLPIAARDVDSRFTVTVPTLPTSGSGLYLSHGVRATSKGAYLVGVRVMTGGEIDLTLEKRSGAAVTTLERVRLKDRVRAGATLKVRLQATGSSKVALTGKVWAAGAAESTARTITHTDSSPARIAGSGAAEFSLYTSALTKALRVGIDDLTVSAAVAAPAPKPTPKPTPKPSEPTSPPPAGGQVAGARAASGAAEPGTRDFPVPSNAVIVSPSGSDSAAGTAASPLRTITAALKKVSNGGTIALRGGTYHESVIIPPQKRVTLQPYRAEAVWMDGAETITGWRKSGNVWIRPGWTQSLDASPTFKRGEPDGTEDGWRFVDPAYPMAAHPDQIWVDGRQLTQVASRSQVSNGRFFVDEKADELVVGSDLTGKKAKVSTLISALSVRSAGSLVQGIGVRRYATSVPSMGTVTIAADNVTLSNVTVRDNSTTGLYTWSKNTTLSDVSVIGNGLLGAGASQADGLEVRRMLSTGNNRERFNRAPVSGALKIHSSSDVVVEDSVFADNFGQGPWFDESNYGVVFSGNDSLRNTGNGVVFELSERAVFADNLVADNALHGILIANAGDAAIWNNTLVGNERNIAVTQNKRRSTNALIPWMSDGVVIANNVVAEPRGECLVCVDDFSRALVGGQMVTRAEGNLYHRASPTAPRWFAIYSRGAAGSSEGFTTLADFRAAAGREKRSVLLEQAASPVREDFSLRSAQASRQTAIAVPVPAQIAAVSDLGSGEVSLGARFP
ncbi:right-handed parallel beta-helix repeat-containing protein [Microbacterium oleivorans]|uniref:right-handed parallel beta-helix repeat-containing protein n=1 Tax=Microbacterium oleivorans TaxID=273677 RepID=UPI00203AE337|nr:right-handed parallel beta-helix repeat-containing protein [Microbacterium oleivorans]MCM3695180.1 right-handed parallel beta-helix repeat-containing protein [Microbacterium oleivorans]